VSAEEFRLDLAFDEYRLVVAPSRGGSILRFDWRGLPIMRPAAGESILDVACFPIVPFSNRIANGRFAWEGRDVALAPNFPGNDHPHPLHGFGWLSPWRVCHSDQSTAVLDHCYAGREWPWAYRAELAYALSARGLRASLSLTNHADTAMPAGLGFHPYFPRSASTVYRGLHCGEWRNDGDCLPLSLEEYAHPRDWWDGAPLSARGVDTVYTRRSGELEIVSPETGLRIHIGCSPLLAFTAVLAPPGVEWFCVEPISHATNAVNLEREDSGLVALRPGETIIATIEVMAAL
jgi:aldose 1-epimerase